MNQTEVALKRPFPVNKLRWRKGGGTKELVYITARDVMDRLDDVFGVEGWSDDYEWLGDRLLCKISCKLNGTGWVTKSDGAEDSTIEAIKGAYSDSFKRAAVKWGIARYLYHPNAFDSSKQPASWATPEGYDELMEKRHGKEQAQEKPF